MDTTVSRRMFFKASGAAAAGVAATLPAVVAASPAEPQAAALAYPHKAVALSTKLELHKPMSFTYPDAESPCALLKMGRPVQGGAGPDGDIVAFSTLCTHMGCAVNYDAQARSFKCGCHFSQFDPELGGQMICGQATENLPQVTLAVTGDGVITATGVQGLIYGRVANLL